MSDVFKAMLALVVLFVLAAWGFDGGGITGMTLAVVSYVFLVAVGLVTVLWLTRRRHLHLDASHSHIGAADTFGRWTNREVETSTGPIRGSHAVIQTLLPIAAVAVGMAAFAVVLHFAGHA
ncbi:MAG: hypothetical protein AB7F22_18205 [Reyranella sp.]|uniref:hypothetical protein n=1 Tax=Reyranella sp. TaxID=1929291 RepID=UPI003D11DA94